MKKTLTSLILVLLTAGLFAAQRSVNEAAAIAAQVNNPAWHKISKQSVSAAPQKTTPSVRLVYTQKQPLSDKAAFYVFDQSDQGFVIVSADDNTRDILAYSNQGSFPEQIPANVQFLLDYIAERIAYTSQIGKAAASDASYIPVAPILDGIQWNQSEPYWNMCPIDKNGDRAYTGCVATATAQVMRYWRWPITGTGTHSYTPANVNQELSVDFSATTYDWDNMPKTTSGYTTSEQKDAVATLMYHVGVAVDMNYGGKTIGGSGAYTSDVATALVNYFGYKNTLESVDTYDYSRGRMVESASTTAQRMREDLAKGHPIVVGGSSAGASSGHEFVFEGYDKNGLFYVNWGWGGSYNGYYAIDNLEPGGSGIGGNGAGYSHFLSYVIGIEPDGSVTPPEPSIPDTISGLQYGKAYYLAGSGSPLWYVDSFKGIDNGYISPHLYFIFNAKSKLDISGTYSLLYVEYTTETGQTIQVDNGNVTISRVNEQYYRFEGIFYGDDGTAYVFDQTIAISAYDADNNNAEITLVEQEWGEWEDFAPFGFNTGKYTFATFGAYTQRDIPVQVREDNTGLTQFKFIGWGADFFTETGIDLIVDMDADYVCTVAKQDLGFDAGDYGENVQVQDYATYFGQAVPSTYNPETGTFNLALSYFISFGTFGSNRETMAMDRIILERDTVKVIADMKVLAEPAKGIIKVSTKFEGISYTLEVVGADTVGTFSLADGTLSQYYYYGIVSDTGMSDFAEGEVSIAKNETGLKLNGLMIGTDEKAYVLDWTYTPITERDTVKVNLEAITVQEDVNSTTQAHRGWLYVGVDTETQYIVQVLGTEQLGTFSYANGTLGKNYYNIIPLDGSSRQQFTEGEVTIVEDAEGLKLTGLLIGEDEKAYALNWIQPAGRLQYDTDAPFDATFAYGDMSTDLDEGVISIYATNAENYTIGLELYADPAATKIPEGVYTISDSQEAGTALKSLGVAGGYLTECFAGVRGTSGISDCWFLVEGTITLSYDEYGKLKVVVDAKNSYGQPVTALIAYEKIEPKKTVDFTDAEVYVYDGFVEQYGIMNFYGGNADGYEFDMYAYADTIAGDFLEAIDFGDCEITAPNGVSIGVIDATEFKVELNGKNLTLTAKVLGSDTVQYNITATGYLGYIDGDAKEAYEGEFAVKEVTIQQVTISKVNYIYIHGANAAGDKLALVVEGELEDGAIMAGEYTEVMASTGYDEEKNVRPSFVTDANNNDWLIQSGKLTVAEDGSMLFEGLNSYDKSVTITIVPTPVDPKTTITYTATEKLQETTEQWAYGLHINAFNAAILSHKFSNDTGTIIFDNEVTTIEEYAFYGCSSLISVTIPNSVTTIGESAFAGCYALADIYTYAVNPPIADNNTFEDVSKHCYIHVPAGTVRDYQLAIGWRDFYHILEISALPDGTTEVGVTVTNNYATFSWPVNPTASSYTLEITKDGELFCTLIFNSLGQLVGMAFAPGLGYNAPAAESTSYGYSFVITGLTDNTTYAYTFSVMDEYNNVIEATSGTFKTTGGEAPTSVDEVHDAQPTPKGLMRKVLRDGQLLIESHNATYTPMGKKVR